MAARTAKVFAPTHLTGDDTDGGFVDTPRDAGDGLGLAGVAVQHRRRQVLVTGCG